MKRTLFLTMAVGAMMLTACNKDDLGGAVLSNETISATLVDEAPQTRTALNGLQVVWNEGDAISVFAENGTSVSNNEGTIKTGVGTTSATFDVIMEGTTKVAAAYPYMKATTYENGIISMTLPDTYQYEENGIGGAPMAALIKTDDTSIAFKNAGALMGITVNNIPEGYNQAILTSDEEAITGACEITFDSEGKPTIKATTNATGKTITINFEAAQTKTNKTFYFPIPVANYALLKLYISGDGVETKKLLKEKPLKAERSMRYKTTLTLDEVLGSTPVEAKGADAATDELESGKNSVNVTINADETDPTITLPESNNQTSLSFEAIPAGKTVTIKAATKAEVSDNVNISASSAEGSDNSFNIDLPKSTVSLNANGETAVYNQVTARTAANTLIIANGVTVKNLLVRGGNVRVHGAVEAISRVADNTDALTCVIYETGAQIPASLGERIKAISAAEWESIKAEELKLRETAKAGGSFTLTQDLIFSETLKVTADMTIDLGGHTITGANLYNDAVISAKGAAVTITGNGEITTRSAYPLSAESMGTLTIENGRFTAQNSTQALYVWNTGGTIYVKGGYFEIDSQWNGTKYFDKNGNGKFVLNCHDKAYKEYKTAKFVVTGGTFYKFDPANNVAEGAGTNFVKAGYSSVAEGECYTVTEGIKNGVALAAALAAGGEVALTDDIELTSAIIVENEVTLNLNNHNITTGKPLYVPSVVSAAICAKENGKLTIKGTGTVDAYSTDDYAVEVRGGELNIEGGKYNGACTSAYALSGTINISGGEFTIGENGTSDYVFVLNLLDDNGKNGTASIHVTGGRYYKFDPSNNKSENPAKNYVAEGYSSTADGDWFVVNKIEE